MLNGLEIRKMRIALNLSERELADELECDQQFVSKLELNKVKYPRLETAERLANFFQINIEVLLLKF
jgi:transcriptional regulator with XRE-family HTH domain